MFRKDNESEGAKSSMEFPSVSSTDYKREDSLNFSICVSSFSIGFSVFFPIYIPMQCLISAPAMDFDHCESKGLISSGSFNSYKAEWTLQSSNATHAVQELAEVLPNLFDSFWRKSGTRYALICKPDSNLLKAVNKSVSKEIDVDTCEIWDGDKLIVEE
jgi:hypothetical protein